MIDPCTAQGCDRPRRGRTALCKMHGQRLRRRGTTDDLRPTVEQRFWAKVNRDGPVPARRPDLGPCWLWTGFTTSEDYPRFTNQDRRPVAAHRFAYELHHGPIDDAVQVDHLCVVPSCVNPGHLEAVGQHENWHRSDCPSSVNARKERCKHGHPLSGDNLHIRRDGSRCCRACGRRRTAESRARRLAREAGDYDDNPNDPLLTDPQTALTKES